jgi:hypothetical protein
MGKKKKKKVRREVAEAVQVDPSTEEVGVPRIILWAAWRVPQKTVVWDDLPSGTYAAVERCVSLTTVRTKGFSGYGVLLDEVAPKLFKMREMAAKEPDLARHLLPIVALLESELKTVLEATEKNIKKGFVKFDDLWALLPDGTEIVFDDAGVLQGGVVSDAKYLRGWSTCFLLTISCIVFDDNSFNEVTREVKVPFFDGTVPIESLSLRPIDATTKARLEERGNKARSLFERGASYLNYNGEMLRRTWFGNKRFRTTGRIMVDPVTFWKMNENYEDGYEDTEESNKPHTLVADGWLVSPWLLGFSFGTKLWGEFNVEQVSPIQFNSRAYDQLVLPDRSIDGISVNVKGLIRSLVEHGDVGFTDFIADKGGGTIFLLHGPPGGGKTLTAEAIADLLQRPLYPISVGELGTSPELLEERLRTVLEVAVLWNAVLLIDEVDIYIERRTASDIERNALVSIFLRLLEYHQGILFLTTNRVTNLDEAFYSRVSLALHYPEHGPLERHTIWANLLDAAGISRSQLDLELLTRASLNGRQIKHVVKIASSLARAANREVRQEDLQQIIAISHQFVEDLRSEGSASNVRRLAPRETLELREGS